ncbi:MAG: hypothetical protein II217_06760, partial [Alistipes sp.]|nr:hypothetical protein [Alistipes sp.]
EGYVSTPYFLVSGTVVVEKKNNVLKLTVDALNSNGVAVKVSYEGPKRKSVNRGRRIRLCIELLDRARTNKGQARIPILVDNAESVQGIEEAFDNVIQFKVG